MRRAALTWHVLRWPREVTPEQVVQLCRLLASVAGQPIVIESVGSAGQVEHRLALAAGRAGGVLEQLRATLPGLAAVTLPARPKLRVNYAATLRLSTRRRPLRGDDLASSSRAILTALAHLRQHEQLCLQWVLARPLPARVVPSRLDGFGPESWLAALLLAPWRPPATADGETRSALLAKQSEPGWQLSGRLAVTATTPARARQLMAGLLGTLRASEAPGVRWHLRAVNPKPVVQAAVPWRGPLRLNVRELGAVAGWPVGLTRELPVIRIGSRVLAPPAALPRTGRVVGEATFPGHERPLALAAGDGLRHLHVLGPSGVGKSTLLLNLIVQDMAAGRAVVVIEPKGDLIADVLKRIPTKRIGDVVLLDPSDTERPVGLNPLSLHGRTPELVADQVLGLFHALYAAHWGPRTHDILGASLLTLARTPNMSLAALPLLLTDAGFRRRIVAGVADPIGLGPFWSGYEAWSAAERAAAIAPVMNKLRPLLLRPELRAIVGHSHGLDLQRVLAQRNILLVNLAKGLLGPETAALLGSLVVSMLWQAVLGRAAIPPERRHAVFVYVDEFQDYLHLPLDLADALAQARGLGVGWVLAHQYLHQLGSLMRSAVLANVQSRVAFRLPSEDARVVSADSLLDPEDFQSLGAFEAYVQLVAGGAVQPWCSARTLAAREPTSEPAAVRRASADAYGTTRATVDAALSKLFAAGSQADSDDLMPRRRNHEASR